MKYLKKFKSIQEANQIGGEGNGLDSPHIDIIEGIRGVVNYAKIQGNYPFNCSFDNSGKIENVSPILPKFTVTLTAGQHGSVSGGGTYTQGTVITITATPDYGYNFISWSDGNTNASRQITVNSDINLSCEFAEVPKETWYFNFNEGVKNFTTDVLFVSNNENFNGIEFSVTAGRYREIVSGFYIDVYDPLLDGWLRDAYRTIILDEPATGDLLTFLQANATKIS